MAITEDAHERRGADAGRGRGPGGPVAAALPRLGVPLVVGEVVAGVGLGPSGAGWLDPQQPTTAFLAEVGVRHAHVRRRHAAAVARPDVAEQSASGRSGRSSAPRRGPRRAAARPAGPGPAHPAGRPRGDLLGGRRVAAPAGFRHRDERGPGRAGVAFAVGWITLLDVLSVLTIGLCSPREVFSPRSWARRWSSRRPPRWGRTSVGAGHGCRSTGEVAFGEQGVGARPADRPRDPVSPAALAKAFGTSILVAGFAAGALLAAAGEPRRLAQQLVGSRKDSWSRCSS